MTASTVSLTTLSRDDLAELRADQQDAYDLLQARGLALDLTRGKPSPAQLDLSNGLLELPGAGHTADASGTDIRNYGGVAGLKELRSIFAELLNIPVDQLVAGDNASLAMMHDVLVYSLLKGNHDSDGPWVQGETVKFLCPSPGYDRHFALCAQFGIEMIPVALNDDGPDVAEVSALVAADPSIKGIWIVPTYANPTGSVVSDDVARGLASMPTAAKDFRIFWDNAYAVHHLTEVETPTADILRFADEAGNPDRVYVFASTSKITFAGSGVCFFGGSDANVTWYLRHLAKRTIGPDKVNQLRHAMFLRDADGVRELMARHRAIIAPKFDLVTSILASRLGSLQAATWTDPKGGYFVSLDVLDGTAARVVELAKNAGIAMTPAGSAFPYGNDPRDRNIRIAPTFPSPDEVSDAIDGLATCVLLAAAEKLLAG